MRRIKTAVIGGGHLGRIHARLLRQNPAFELVAVCDPQPLIQQRMIEDFDVRAVSHYQKIIGEIEAAVIATPTTTHAEIATDCLQQGIHLLIEKPITADFASAVQIEQMATALNRIVQVGHVERYNTAVATALGTIGAPRFLSAIRTSPYPFRSFDVGVVLDLMIHDIDLANAVFDTPLTSVQAWGESIVGVHEDIATAFLSFANGGTAQFHVSRCNMQPQRCLQLYGDRGYACIDLVHHMVKSVHYPDWLQRREIDINQLPPGIQNMARERFFEWVLPSQEIQVEPINAIAQEQADWADAIRKNRPSRVTLRQAVSALEIATRVVEAISYGKRTKAIPIAAKNFGAIPTTVPPPLTIPPELHSYRAA